MELGNLKMSYQTVQKKNFNGPLQLSAMNANSGLDGNLFR